MTTTTTMVVMTMMMVVVTTEMNQKPRSNGQNEQCAAAVSPSYIIASCRCHPVMMSSQKSRQQQRTLAGARQERNHSLGHPIAFLLAVPQLNKNLEIFHRCRSLSGKCLPYQFTVPIRTLMLPTKTIAIFVNPNIPWLFFFIMEGVTVQQIHHSRILLQYTVGKLKNV
jgi:hypothetical protein